MTSDHEEHDLEIVHACEDDEESNIIIGYLRSQGIEAQIESELPHDVLPVEGDSRIYVNQEDAARARQLIAERESGPPLVDENTVPPEAEPEVEEA